MTTISGTLKPCPWCGGEAETRNSRWNRRDHWGVACTGCGDPWFDCRSDIEAEAIAAWNNREAAEARAREEGFNAALAAVYHILHKCGEPCPQCHDAIAALDPAQIAGGVE